MMLFLKCGFLIPAKRNSCCAQLQETVRLAGPVPPKIYKFRGSLGFFAAAFIGRGREDGVGYAGAPAMLGMLCKGSRARRPQGFWFLSQPVLFWPGASIYLSLCPSHSAPRLCEAPLECGALRTLGKKAAGTRALVNFSLHPVMRAGGRRCLACP